MNKLKIILFLFISIILYINNSVNAAINFTVSPIRYEIDAFTGTTVGRTALLRNNSDIPVNIITGKTDFESNGATGVPKFVRYSELVHPDQQLSTWINVDTAGFTINPNEEKTVNFTIDVPNDATPGGHYGAVCFKNQKSENSTGGNIGINVDYCILLLVNVDGEIVTDAEVKDTVITVGGQNAGGGSSNGNGLVKDDCPFIDLTASNYDGKCIDNFFSDENLDQDINNLNQNEESDLTPDDFIIDFETLFINEGNTHLNPTGNIVLVDDNGNQIKGIGKESIKNEEGAKIGEKVVDYLPINDEGGNVLPGQGREFNVEWKGFPYEAYDENGKIVIKYWTPEEYYTMKNTQNFGYIMPWQRINERINEENIKANINVSYVNKDGENVEFNSAKDFTIYYKDKYIGTNPYAVLCTFIFFLVVWILWLIFRKKKIKCINCKKKLEEDMIICPYCGVKQDDKRYIKNKKMFNRKLEKVEKLEIEEEMLEKEISETMKKVKTEENEIKKSIKKLKSDEQKMKKTIKKLKDENID
ncbi:MAG: hypothetical protein PHS49_04630 [Candidatus Gracilibacteria bacterium]|nr:hypothetical protein [Candidatus Gracilibacteria bacterium]